MNGLKRSTARLAGGALALLMLAGCGVGTSRLVFVTNTSHGIDLETTPPRTSITMSRQVGVVSPQFPGGEVPPVTASVTRHDRSNWLIPQAANEIGKFFGFGTSQNFAVGDAAVLLANSNPMPESAAAAAPAGVSESTEAGHGYGVDRYHGLLEIIFVDFIGKGIFAGGKIDHNKKNPYFFGTNTNFGLDVSYTPDGTPKSLNLGLKRQEVAVVLVAPPKVDDAGNVLSEAKVPSLISMFKLQVEEPGEVDEGGKKKQKSTLETSELFATGKAADALARNQQARETILQPVLFGAAVSALSEADQDAKTAVADFLAANPDRRGDVDDALKACGFENGYASFARHRGSYSAEQTRCVADALNSLRRGS